MSDTVCNYAIARFRPFADSGEFVNVGVVLVCPVSHYLGFEFVTGDHRRVADFFPDLDMETFRRGMEGLRAEIARIASDLAGDTDVVREGSYSLRTRFEELVRPRESMFRFGEIGTAMTCDPHAKLDELFQRYVGCRSARAETLKSR